MGNGEREARAVAEAETAGDAQFHLLLVEDDAVTREYLQRVLSNLDWVGEPGASCSFHDAENGEQALEEIHRLSGDGLRVCHAIVDFNLGGGRDGIETIRDLWRIDPEIHCVLVTGDPSTVESHIARRVPDQQLQRFDYLAKPFSAFEIAFRVRRELAHWRARRAQERARTLAAENREQQRRNRELETALRELEKAQARLLQQEKLACIGQLAAGVAHELNNPIGYVHSNLGTLGRYFEKLLQIIEVQDRALATAGCGSAPEIEEARKKAKFDFLREDLPNLLRESVEGTDRARKIVSDLKLFSHPGDQRPRLFDLNEGLRSTLSIVWNELKYKAEVSTDFGSIPPLLCEPAQVNQVFLNLLVNAAQAIENRGTISIRTAYENGEIRVRIADTGCGIPPENLRRLFEPFFTTKEPGKGTGLGLAISLDIVRKYGGHIEVESAVGAGTAFTVRIPVRVGVEGD